MNETLTKLSDFIGELSQKPLLHVNGHEYPLSLISVDFGQPSTEQKLTTDEEIKLNELLKEAGKSLSRRNSKITVKHDNKTGVYWASTNT